MCTPLSTAVTNLPPHEDIAHTYTLVYTNTCKIRSHSVLARRAMRASVKRESACAQCAQSSIHVRERPETKCKRQTHRPQVRTQAKATNTQAHLRDPVMMFFRGQGHLPLRLPHIFQ